MLHASKAFKCHLVLCKLTLIFCVLQKTAVRLIIFLFKVFYSFFTYIVLEYFPCLLHHWNASATNLIILSLPGLSSLSSIHFPRKYSFFPTALHQILVKLLTRSKKVIDFGTFNDTRTSLPSIISHANLNIIQQMVSGQGPGGGILAEKLPLSLPKDKRVVLIFLPYSWGRISILFSRK